MLSFIIVAASLGWPAFALCPALPFLSFAACLLTPFNNICAAECALCTEGYI